MDWTVILVVGVVFGLSMSVETEKCSFPPKKMAHPDAQKRILETGSKPSRNVGKC
jgi:hypothetical protein